MTSHTEKTMVPAIQPETRPGLPAVDAARHVYEQLTQPGRRDLASWQIGRLAAELQVLREAADLDDATGLLKRASLKAQYERLQGLVREHPDQTLAFFLIDVDDFKHINLDFKFSGGDQVIEEMGQRLRHLYESDFRKGDAIGRWGGDEFVILAPLTRNAELLPNVSCLQTRIRQGLQHEATYLGADASGQVRQLDISCSVFLLDGTEDIDEVVNAAHTKNEKVKWYKKQLGQRRGRENY